MKNCLDCNIVIYKKSLRCKSCFHKSTKGRLAWNSGTRIQKYCIDCKKPLSGSSNYIIRGIETKRCKNCWKIFQHNNWIAHPNSLKALKPKSAEWLKEKKIHLGHKLSEEGKKRLSARMQGIPIEEWTEFIKPIQTRLRDSLEYEDWRKKVFERDLYTCQHCGEVGGRLEADHIKSFALYPELRFELSNGRTLCHDCHVKTDTWGWRTKWAKRLL